MANGKIFCPSCGQENVAGAKFCTHCGKPLPQIQGGPGTGSGQGTYGYPGGGPSGYTGGDGNTGGSGTAGNYYNAGAEGAKLSADNPFFLLAMMAIAAVNALVGIFTPFMTLASVYAGQITSYLGSAYNFVRHVSLANLPKWMSSAQDLYAVASAFGTSTDAGMYTAARVVIILLIVVYTAAAALTVVQLITKPKKSLSGFVFLLVITCVIVCFKAVVTIAVYGEIGSGIYRFNAASVIIPLALAIVGLVFCVKYLREKKRRTAYYGPQNGNYGY